MLWIVLIFIVVVIVVELFISRTLSPIPYFPSNHLDDKLILKALNLRNDQVIIDLGAGDGWIIFMAAAAAYQQNLKTSFVATDINPVLLSIMYIKRLFHPNRKNIKIVYHNMFKASLKPLLPKYKTATLYLYISPWFLKDVVTKVKTELPRLEIVSYYYALPDLKPTVATQGRHKIHLYK